MKKVRKKHERGITLIVLVITIIVLIILASISIGTLTGKNGIINNSKFAKFSAQIKEYQSELDDYVMQQELLKGGKDEIIIYESNPEEIKKIITTMTDEDAEKYVIQENKIRYNPDAVDSKEKEWLAEIGVIAMVAVYAITFMNKGEVYKTIYSDKITFPLINPTSRDGNFAGWYYDEETTNEATQGDEIVQEITLYAGYKEREMFTITYIANGSVFAEIQGDEIVYPETNPSSTLGNFAGWYYDEQGKDIAEEGTKLKANQTIYANWSDFIATYMGDGKVFETISGNTLKFPTTNPTKDTVKFTGWYYDEACTKVANTGDVITKDTTFYPKWNSYIINKLNGEGNIIDRAYYPTYGGDSRTQYEKFDTPDYVGYVEYSKYIISGEDLYYAYKGSNPIIETKVISSIREGRGQENEKIDPVVIITDDGQILSKGYSGGSYYNKIEIEFTFSDGTTDTDEIWIYAHFMCLAEGTEITLADRTRKNIEDITYEDELLVWDFDNGKFATAKPLFISKKQVTTEYNYIKFEDGTELKTVIDHRIFNMEAQKFTYTMDEENTPIGTIVFKEDGTTTKLIERKVVKEKVNYYNIITAYHMNLFANGILTSLRLNNLYEIKDMKFVKDNRKLTPREEFKNIPDKYFYGLRLAEQSKEINRGNDVRHTNTLEEYVERLTKMAKE